MGLIEISYKSSFPANGRASLFPSAVPPGEAGKVQLFGDLLGWGDSTDHLVHHQMDPVWKLVLRVSVKDSWKQE